MFKSDLKEFVKKEFFERLRVKTYYQPIIDLSSKEVYGYEALSRFEMDGSTVSPIKMFDMAQRFGLAAELDFFCRKLAIENFPKDLGGGLFLNIYPSYVVSDYLGEGHTLKLALESGLKAKNIILELIEVEKLSDIRLFKTALSYYKDIGFQVCIDDIGTGFNSLEYLLNLEGFLDYVKIPRELVNGVSRSKIRYNLVKVITEVSLNIGARPIYEGLEREEDIIILYQDFDAQLIQGFYFSPPLPPDKLKDFKPQLSFIEDFRDKCPNSKKLESFYFKGEEKFAYFLEKLEEFQDRYIMLNVDGALYLLDSWMLKSQLNDIRKNLYFYKSLGEVIPLMKESFVSVENLPKVNLKESKLRCLLDLVTSSNWNVYIVGKEDGTVELVERHSLIDYLHRRLSKELLDSNPLTQLPGNRSIEEKIKKLGSSGSEFYVCHLDIDNFKAFNDAYGFYAGDQMIKKVGFVLKNFEAKHPDKVFVGHVGGDDFILVLWGMTQDAIKGQLLSLLRELKENLLEFYSLEDRERGYFVARGRDEELREFPLADVSMVLVKGSSDPLDVSRRSAQLKKKAKSFGRSALVVEGLNEILTIDL